MRKKNMKKSKLKPKKVRRGKRKSSKSFVKTLRFLGVNAAGLKPRLTTFKKVLSELKPSVFMVEETKYNETGKLKLDNYVIFEAVRENKCAGGGLALGCSKELSPAWVREGINGVEALSVDIFLKRMKIRCCAAYGPQENDLVDKKDAFWKYLDEDVIAAKDAGAGFILQFDGNLWAGSGLVPGDPRPQNRNGKMFKEFLDRNNLTVVNSLQICEGLLTRKRSKDGKLEVSILDFFVVCSYILPFVTRMVIDERKNYILTNYQSAKKTGKAIDSDHLTQYMDVNLKFSKEKPDRQEMLNFKDKEGQKTFKISTSKTDEFSNCFKTKLPLLKQVENWRNVLSFYCKKSFKKIRIRRKTKIFVNKSIAELIDKRNNLLQEGSEKDLEEIDRKIAELEATEIRSKIMNNFKIYSENPENVSLPKVWKLLKKISPKTNPTLPTAKRNHKGKLISGPKEIKTLLAKEYKNRLRSRPIRPDLKETKQRRQKIFKMKMKIAEGNRGKDWTMKDLDKALADLKNDKSRDFSKLM